MKPSGHVLQVILTLLLAGTAAAGPRTPPAAGSPGPDDAGTPSRAPGRQERIPAGDVVRGALGSELDGFLTGLAPEGLSGAVLVARGGVVYLKKGYGQADREQGLANTSETRFNVGAVATVFTAAAILRLQADGRLSLDDPVSRHLGDFPPGKSAATLHQLLTHTSGLVAPGQELDLASRRAFIASIKEARRGGPPGTDFSYSDAGYTLLAAVVEEVSGLAFETFVHRRLLAPAGMASTGFAWEPAGPGMERARGYEGLRPEDLSPSAPMGEAWGLRGAQGVVSTVGDLYRWILALRDGTLLPAEETDRMLTAHVGSAGYGWHVVDSVDGPLARRGGALPGFECSVRWYRDDDLVIVFALNNQLGLRIPVAKGIDGIVKKHAGPPATCRLGW